jgi:hypothetical protein
MQERIERRELKIGKLAKSDVTDEEKWNDCVMGEICVRSNYRRENALLQ